MDITARFLNYIAIDTTSYEKSTSIPSNPNELMLGEMLVKELKSLGLSDARLDDKGIVYAHLDGEGKMEEDGLGFIAHLDTSSDMKGAKIKARLIKNYQGEVIFLDKEEKIKLDPLNFPNLLKVKGDDLLVTDGTTLLGADDKAGIAAIMDMLEYYHDNPAIKHRPIAIAFTPDEEIGRGVDHFDLDKFKAKKAYTVDGGAVDTIEYENFNAAEAKVVVHGSSIHPGDAKGKMINSQLVAMEYNSLLPYVKRPEYTEGYEGFNHLLEIRGTCEETSLTYIIRNHDLHKFNEQKKEFISAREFIDQKYGQGTIDLEISDTYYNMKELILRHPEMIKEVKEKMALLGLDAKESPIRGGTDGAMLTYKGLPCPNLGAGGFNFHGKFEYLSINQLKKASELLKLLTKIG